MTTNPWPADDKPWSLDGRAGRFETFTCGRCGYTEWYARIAKDPAESKYVRLIDNEPKSEGPYR